MGYFWRSHTSLSVSLSPYHLYIFSNIVDFERAHEMMLLLFNGTRVSLYLFCCTTIDAYIHRHIKQHSFLPHATLVGARFFCARGTQTVAEIPCVPYLIYKINRFIWMRKTEPGRESERERDSTRRNRERTEVINKIVAQRRI